MGLLASRRAAVVHKKVALKANQVFQGLAIFTNVALGDLVLSPYGQEQRAVWPPGRLKEKTGGAGD